MPPKTLCASLDSPLTLYAPTGIPLALSSPELVITRVEEGIESCQLRFQVQLEQYERIDAEAWFNLKPEIRGTFAEQKFLPQSAIAIAADLQPNLLPCLMPYIADINTAALYLSKQSQNHPDHLLVSTESWYATCIKQDRGKRQRGYRTLWHHLKLSTKTPAILETDDLMDAVLGFLSERPDIDISVLERKISEDADRLITNEMNDIVMEEVGDFLHKFFESPLFDLEHPDSATIFTTVREFFEREDWPIRQLDEDLALGMAFQGENGQFTCYAKALAELQQFVFYSFCPVNVPENKQMTVAELLVRINNGLIVGNFEFNFGSGQICYKTSIDVEGDRLSVALVEQLVYANVLTMDRYLPAILCVIQADITPKAALAHVEG